MLKQKNNPGKLRSNLSIALLHPSLDVRGGAEKQILNLAKELKLLGHQVTLYVSRVDKANSYSELMNNVDIVECGGYGYNSIKKEIFYSFHYMKKMAKKIKSCDIINCHNFPTTYAAGWAKKRIKVPVVWMCNEPPFPPLYEGWRKNKSFKSWIYRLVVLPFLFQNKLILKHINKILVLDKMNQKRIKKTYDLNSDIVWTGIDYPKLSEKNLGLSIRGKRKEINLFTVSRLDNQRRIHDIILLAARMKRDKIPFNIEIAGGGPAENSLKELAIKKGVSEFVHFLGRISNKNLYKAYARSDVVLFTPENQSWGLVPIEAAYFGRPSLISNGCGVKSVFEHQKNALIYSVGNIDDMFEKLLILIKNRELIRFMGDKARSFVLANFSWKKYAKSMENIFLNCIQ